MGGNLLFKLKHNSLQVVFQDFIKENGDWRGRMVLAHCFESCWFARVGSNPVTGAMNQKPAAN